MPIYKLTPDRLEPVARTTFEAERLHERRDLQARLKRDISIVGEGLLVVAEEFGDWDGSARRIDLLCLASDGDLVVVEIKRTEDGGHMELQALRYAAMVSGMTLDGVVHAHARFAAIDPDSARDAILAHLKTEDGGLTGKVRIVLVSSNFSQEVATTVLWLNRHGLDITCFRMIPYSLGADVLLDVTQIIPLPEAADYEVRLKSQANEKQAYVSERQQAQLKFWTQFLAVANGTTNLFAKQEATMNFWLFAPLARPGFCLNISLSKTTSFVECGIRFDSDPARADAEFRLLLARRAEIEAAFGEALDWQERPDRACRNIASHCEGGWQSPEAGWPDIQRVLIDRAIRLDAALRKPIMQLVV